MTPGSVRRVLLPAMSFSLALWLAACGSAPSARPGSTTTTGPGTTTTGPGTTTTGAPSPTTTSTAPAPGRISVSLYLMRGDVLGVSHRSIPATQAVGSAALRALFGGPDGQERVAGLSTAVPAGTALIGLTITGGVATVDVSGAFGSGGGSLSMTARLAQVVYTLTQFPTVHTVRLKMDGRLVTALGGEGILVDHPIGRLDAAVINVVPLILLENPAVGDRVHSPLHVSGLSNTFEATYHVQLLDPAGAVLVDASANATSGTGTWGTFDASFPYTTSASGTGTLRVYEVSAKDGSPVHEVRLSVPVGP